MVASRPPTNLNPNLNFVLAPSSFHNYFHRFHHHSSNTMTAIPAVLGGNTTSGTHAVMQFSIVCVLSVLWVVLSGEASSQHSFSTLFSLPRFFDPPCCRTFKPSWHLFGLPSDSCNSASSSTMMRWSAFTTDCIERKLAICVGEFRQAFGQETFSWNVKHCGDECVFRDIIGTNLAIYHLFACCLVIDHGIKSVRNSGA